MNYYIDKNSNIKVYKQIADQIAEAVRNGRLKPGQKLPTERELSDILHVARGTVKKAYEELRNSGIIHIVPSSGSFVLEKRGVPEADRKEIAVAYIRELLERLEELHFTHGETRALFDFTVSERENRQKKVYVATIDCNPESLAVFREQFSSFSNVEFRMFLIDDIITYSDPLKVFEDYDIIITTTTHYEQIISMLHPLRSKLFKVAVSPAQETVIMIATIPREAKTGMIVRSNNFKNLMLTRLESMKIDTAKVEYAFEDDISKVDKLFLEMDVLIIPHFLLLDNRNLARKLHYFESRGGKTIDFKYQIEKGSLIYIEDRVRSILSGGAKNQAGLSSV